MLRVAPVAAIWKRVFKCLPKTRAAQEVVSEDEWRNGSVEEAECLPCSSLLEKTTF